MQNYNYNKPPFSEQILDFEFLVACYATLHPALSVGWSVGRSVGWSVTLYFFYSFYSY